MATYKVIDVSDWQGKIDWKKVKADGVVGAIIRYADGTTLDKRFAENMKNAKANGLHIGSYIFSRAKTKTEAEKEATRLYNACKSYSPDLPLYIDLEAAAIAKYADTVAAAFLNKMKVLGGCGGVYANLNWWNNYLTKTAKNYSASPFWIAQYNEKITHKNPSLFGMWQYTSKGKANGISGNVDRDKLYVPYWNNAKVVPTKKTVDEIAKEVIDGKWDNGDKRKKQLEKAGYDYNAVQMKVNELLTPSCVELANIWARKIITDNRYHYNMWSQSDAQSHKCPICSKLKYEDNEDDFGWNCIGFGAAVWKHGMGLTGVNCNCHWITAPNGNAEKLLTIKSDAEALEYARKCIGVKDIKLIRNKDGIPKDEWKAGDICLRFSGNTCEHIFYYAGNKKIIDSTRVYSDKKKWTAAVKAKQIAERSWDNYSAKVIIRYIGE